MYNENCFRIVSVQEVDGVTTVVAVSIDPEPHGTLVVSYPMPISQVNDKVGGIWRVSIE